MVNNQSVCTPNSTINCNNFFKILNDGTQICVAKSSPIVFKLKFLPEFQGQICGNKRNKKNVIQELQELSPLNEILQN